ncbi:Transmembrane protein 8A-like protein [Leptotrombidium deliense]|uniref:Transmembrane protein 8A-like protein n=1 Tax=Leptotrombidium deliense TaxID=299467 RepID=A0A443SAR5_9ACAR|nr:Transmembrane protein 8A-like protein [Leptotrombidium deliense]
MSEVKELMNSNQVNALRQIFPLRSYKDAQIFRYYVVDEAVTASWTFFSNISDGCQQVNVTVVLKWKGFPVVNIKNSSNGDNFVNDEREQHIIVFRSDSKLFTYNVTNPLPGEWYALVHTDKIENRILPKGLIRGCQAYFSSQLTFSKLPQIDGIVFLSPSVPTQQLIKTRKMYRFFLSQQTYSAKINITNCSQLDSIDNECPITVFFRGLALPAENKFDKSFECKQLYRKEDGCPTDDLNISRNGWNYLLIKTDSETPVGFELLLIVEDCIDGIPRLSVSKPIRSTTISPTTQNQIPTTAATTENSFLRTSPQSSKYQAMVEHTKACPREITLMRYNYPGYFEYKYDNPDIWTNRKSKPYSPAITIDNSNLFERTVSLIYFEVIPNVDTGGNLVIEVQLNPATNTTYHNVSVTLCLSYNRYSLMMNDCLKSVSVKSTSLETKSFVIPYPRAGIWYITATADCFFIQRDFPAVESPVNCEFNTTSILLEVKSSSCNEGKCGKYGDCYQKIDSGFVYSTCVCKPELGWKGWFCEDSSEALRDNELLMNFMLLTISNLMFIPSVILASYKRHFTEALVYFTTMVSSALYHACDSESAHSFCLLRMNILQFGDFYTALLAFWVTLISLANLNEKLKSFFHIFGAILIGFVVQYDRTSLWAFVLPSGIGSTILLIAWVSHCVRRRACFPTAKLWFLSVLPGISLTIGGLVLFSLFTTKENYQLTHSIWHGIMALSLLLLIPSMRSEQVEEEEDFRGKGSNYETYYELIAEEASHLARHPLS